MVWEFLFSLVLFGITVSAIPLFIFLYLYLNIFRRLWISGLSLLYPEVEFVREVTVKSLLDTKRNQGVVTVLLNVKGQAQPEAIRRHLQEVVNRRNKLGGLSFPRLRQCLATKWGIYAWQSENFDLDQNIIMAPNIYKGRPVAEYNIQDYVSDIVAKYLPSGIPPWQFIIIPSTDDYHYILLKIHHVLLSDGVNIGDLLPILPPTRTSSGSFSMKSPLVNVFKKPVVMPILKDRLTEDISNIWNEFIANFDPLERPELLKYVPTFPQFIAIVLISAVSTVKDCKKGFNYIKSDAFSRFHYIIITAKRETMKRQVNGTTLILSMLVSLDPRNILSVVFKTFWNVFVAFPLQLPIYTYAEFKALYACLTLNYCPYPRTIVGILYAYVPLFYNSFKEIINILSVLVAAPKTVLQDILLQKESIQTITLCGRKCVAWSDPIKVQTINEVATQTASTGTEIMLAAVSICLSNYFTQINHPIPEDLPIFIRNISSSYVYATGPHIKAEDAMSGMLCLNLSIPDPDKDASEIENLLDIKNKFSTALEKQGLSHLLTILQTKFGILTKFLPSTCLSIYLKYLSSKYSVSVTEITSRYPHVTQRTLWGQEVLSVIYWRPPQANTSIALCLNEYADDVRLGVMCDAQLMPHHTALVRGFPQYIQDLKKTTKIQ